MNELDIAIAIAIIMSMTAAYSLAINEIAEENSQDLQFYINSMKAIEESNKMLETCENAICTEKFIKSHQIQQLQDKKQGFCISRLALYNGSEVAIQACA